MSRIPGWTARYNTDTGSSITLDIIGGAPGPRGFPGQTGQEVVYEEILVLAAADAAIKTEAALSEAKAFAIGVALALG